MIVNPMIVTIELSHYVRTVFDLKVLYSSIIKCESCFGYDNAKSLYSILTFLFKFIFIWEINRFIIHKISKLHIWSFKTNHSYLIRKQSFENNFSRYYNSSPLLTEFAYRNRKSMTFSIFAKLAKRFRYTKSICKSPMSRSNETDDHLGRFERCIVIFARAKNAVSSATILFTRTQICIATVRAKRCRFIIFSFIFLDEIMTQIFAAFVIEAAKLPRSGSARFFHYGFESCENPRRL